MEKGSLKPNKKQTSLTSLIEDEKVIQFIIIFYH